MTRLVQALDPHRRVELVPFQAAEALGRCGLARAEAERAAWAVLPDGRRFRGAGAVLAVVSVLLRSPVPLRLYALPPVRRLADAAYAWTARNRHRFPGDRPFCEQHPERCC